MFRAMNRMVLAAAVFASAFCAMGFPMLLGEPDMLEGTGEMLCSEPVESDTSDSSFVQQMQQPSETMARQLQNAVMACEEPVNVEQMQQVGNPTEMQPAQQPQLVATMQPPTGAETVQSEQPSDMIMLSDEPSMVNLQSDQPQILAAAQEMPVQEAPAPEQQPAPCLPASDCPEKDEETNMPSDQTPSAATNESSQSETKPIVVMQSDDKPDDKFLLPHD